MGLDPAESYEHESNKLIKYPLLELPVILHLVSYKSLKFKWYFSFP